MPPEPAQSLARRSRRAEAILRVVSREGHITEFFADAARCTTGEAVVELLRLEREGLIRRGRSGFGMTWEAVR